MEAEGRRGLRTFLGVNTGPVSMKKAADAASSAPHVEASGQVLANSEALAFSLSPGMVALSPATFRLVAPFFDCYGTGSIGLWGECPATLKTVYVVNNPKKAQSWRHRLDDDSVPLYGREEELNLISRYWDSIKSHTSKEAPLLVHLVGEPGAGKSRLLQAFLAKLKYDENAITVLKLAGSHYGQRSGLLLQELVAECSREDSVTPEVASSVRPIGSLRRIGPTRASERAAHAQMLLQMLADRGPLLLVIDDLHWADRDSVGIIGMALGRLRANMMVIVSYRRSGSSKARLLTDANTRYIALKPLDESTAKKISAFHSAGESFPESFCRKIWEKSRGNPLYIEEATRLLLKANRDPVKRGGLTRPDDLLPYTMAGLLVARIKEWAEKELGDLQAELRHRMGRSSPRTRLARIETQINDWLDRLETQNYVERSELVECLEALEQFQNKVVMLCVVGGLVRPFNTRLEAAVSRLYEGCYDDHYRYLRRRVKTPENRSSAGTQSLLAARRALGQGRPLEAARFFKIADEALSTDHPLRTRMFVDAGDANLMIGCLTEAIRFYEKALIREYASKTEGGTHFKLAAARILNGEKITLSEPEQESNPSPWNIVLMSLAAILSGKMELAIKCASEAEEKGEANCVPDTYLILLGAIARLRLGNHDGAKEWCAKVARNVATGGPSIISLVLHWILSLADQGCNRQKHIRTWKDIAKRLGATSGLSLYQSRLIAGESNGPEMRHEGSEKVSL